MTQENLLNDEPNDLPVVDPDKDYFEELVGEGRKFKDQKALAKSKFEADQLIDIYKRRMDQMRDDYLKERQRNSTQERLEELVNQLSTKQSISDDTQAKEKNQPEFDPKQVESLVSNKIQEYETTRLETSNFNQVKDKLQQTFGNNYKSVVKSQIEDLGITDDELDAMARKRPKALLKILGVDREPRQDSFQSPPQNQRRSDGFAPRGAQKRTWAYYQELKKANPQLYFDPKIAVQMQKDAIELGEVFRDGDYYRTGVHEPNT